MMTVSPGVKNLEQDKKRPR